LTQSRLFFVVSGFLAGFGAFGLLTGSADDACPTPQPIVKPATGIAAPGAAQVLGSDGAAFRASDRNSDGLDQHEYRDFSRRHPVHRYGNRSARPQAREQTFRAIDRNQDRKLSPAELNAAQH
jgi:hypothetical protein